MRIVDHHVLSRLGMTSGLLAGSGGGNARGGGGDSTIKHFYARYFYSCTCTVPCMCHHCFLFLNNMKYITFKVAVRLINVFTRSKYF